MTIHWKAVEQYFTVNFTQFVVLELSTIRSYSDVAGDRRVKKVKTNLGSSAEKSDIQFVDKSSAYHHEI